LWHPLWSQGGFCQGTTIAKIGDGRLFPGAIRTQFNIQEAMPKVSVVMPTYNQAAFIRESVDSILAQTFGDFELIIVNDTSTDGTAEIIHAISDQRVSVFTHEANQGASAAMNTGFARASGEYLTWLASDNCFKPEFLEKMVGALETDTNAGFVFCSFENVDADGKFLDHVFLSPPYPGFLHVEPGGVGVGFLYRRTVAEACGPYLDLVCNDLDYWLKAARQSDFVYVPDVLAVNRKHGAMQTVVRREELAEQVKAVLAEDRRRGFEARPNLFALGADVRKAALRLGRAFELAAKDDRDTQWIIAGDSPLPEMVTTQLGLNGWKVVAESDVDKFSGRKCFALDGGAAKRMVERGCEALLYDVEAGMAYGWNF